MDDDEYKVGKGRPPLHSRFKPGQSGNPKGRPRRGKTVADQIDRILSGTVTIRENGLVQEVTCQEAMFKSLAAKAMRGDHRAAAFLLNARHTYQDSSAERIDPKDLNAEDRKILDAYLKRHGTDDSER
jgi:hypothetical protein